MTYAAYKDDYLFWDDTREATLVVYREEESGCEIVEEISTALMGEMLRDDKPLGTREPGDQAVWCIPVALLGEIDTIRQGDRIYDAGHDDLDSQSHVWSIRTACRANFDTVWVCECVRWTQQLNIEDKSGTIDTNTGFRTSGHTETLSSLWGSVGTIGAENRLELSQRGIQVTHRILFDRDPGITGTEQRIVHGTRYYSPRGRSVKLQEGNLWEILALEQAP